MSGPPVLASHAGDAATSADVLPFVPNGANFATMTPTRRPVGTVSTTVTSSRR